MTNGKRVLVTGGAGFIGSHLVERLLALGCQVTVLDDLSTGREENLPGDPALDLVVGDVADAATVTRAVAGRQAVFHLAAVASVQASVEDPERTHRSNLLGTMRLLEAVEDLGVDRFVYASSASVYGPCKELPSSEESATQPLSPYAIDKLAGEHFLSYYHQRGRIHGTAFRFFNVYGPRQDPSSPYSGVISLFARAALEGEPLTVYGDGGQTRDFVFVADLVHVLVAAMTWERRAEADLFNVGRGLEVSLLQLLSELEEIRGCTIERRFAPPRAGDIRASRAHISRLMRRLPDLEFTGLRQGLESTLEHLGRVAIA